MLDNLPSDIGHDDGGLAVVAGAGVHGVQHVAEEGRHRGEDDLVGQQLPVVAEDRHVREQAVGLTQLRDGDDVAVMTIEGHHSIPSSHYGAAN